MAAALCRKNLLLSGGGAPECFERRDIHKMVRTETFDRPKHVWSTDACDVKGF